MTGSSIKIPEEIYIQINELSLSSVANRKLEFFSALQGWTVGLWVMLNLIMEQWLLGGKIQSQVVNVQSEELSEPANVSLYETARG